MNLNLLKDAKIIKVSNGATAGTSEVDGSAVDMSGFNSVCYIVDLGTVTDGSVLTLQIQDGPTSSPTTNMTGASATFTASGSSNTTMIVDVQKVQQRYNRAKFTRTTDNAVVNTILAILYNANSKPVTLDASVLASTEVEATN
jgi:hypothetical protein